MKWVLILVLCASSAVDSTVLSFLVDLPWEIGNSFSNAWTAFKDLVKKPVRIKRLGSGGPRKPTTALPTTTVNIVITETEEPSNPIQPKRPTLPVFALPTWKTLHRWNQMQQPKLQHTRGYNAITDRSTYRLLNFLTASDTGSNYGNLVLM